LALILNIETATKTCSVALAKNGALVGQKSLSSGAYSHAENLHPFIDSLLKEHQVSAAELDAIAISMGPGSYTGLRIGVSTAKGLCYALNIPLIAVGTLELMCHSEKLKSLDADLFCPMIDARRSEVFTALFNKSGQMVKDVEALILDTDSFSTLLQNQRIAFFGDGSAKFAEMINNPNAVFVDGVEPLASQMISLSEARFAAGKFEDVAYFEPFYLKEFMATTPKKQL
jgi:tRNA threonylcarbamoyladenosine biosynthesis protein TsaB